MGATEGTKLTSEYTEMEQVSEPCGCRDSDPTGCCCPQKTEAVIDLVDDLINRTKEYLQPNPGACFL